MKNILVVSDNEPLVRHLKALTETESIKKIANFIFCFSVINKNPTNLIAMQMTPINLKDMDICKQVIDSYQLVFSLHCKQIFPAHLVKNVVCINVHPGLNPHNRGWYPQVFSIINKKPIGATIHVMDEDVDHGSIISQEEVKIHNTDTSLDVYNRVLELEKKLIDAQLENIINGHYQLKEVEGDGNYNSIQDFNNLCHLDLNGVGTLSQHIDLLRALTHGQFNNGFFIDNGNKVYVKIHILPTSEMCEN